MVTDDDRPVPTVSPELAAASKPSKLHSFSSPRPPPRRSRRRRRRFRGLLRRRCRSAGRVGPQIDVEVSRRRRFLRHPSGRPRRVRRYPVLARNALVRVIGHGVLHHFASPLCRSDATGRSGTLAAGFEAAFRDRTVQTCASECRLPAERPGVGRVAPGGAGRNCMGSRWQVPALACNGSGGRCTKSPWQCARGTSCEDTERIFIW